MDGKKELGRDKDRDLGFVYRGGGGGGVLECSGINLFN